MINLCGAAACLSGPCTTGAVSFFCVCFLFFDLSSTFRQCRSGHLPIVSCKFRQNIGGAKKMRLKYFALSWEKFIFANKIRIVC